MPEKPIKKREPSGYDWIAPEHVNIAKSMTRDKYGALIIEPHPIFKYSKENPPAWLRGRVRKAARQ